MKAPCIAVDVSKGKSHIQGFYTLDKKVGKVKVLEHNLADFEEILLLAKQIEKEVNVVPIVVFEATGIYHKPLQVFLDNNDLKYCIISPLESAKIRKSHIRTVKTDKRDCSNIALAYFTRDFPLYSSQDDLYYEILCLNRHYNFLMNELRVMKVEYHRLLDLVFPGFDNLYSDIYSQTPLAIIKKYKHPDEIKNKRNETLAKTIKKDTCHNFNWSMHEARKLIDYANNCASGVRKNDMEVHILNEVLVRLIIQMEMIEECLTKLVTLSSRLDNYLLIKSIPGIGENLASRICAEIGDITRFKNGSSLVAYAGLDSHIYQSGQNDGLHIGITKKGNKNLRCLLYLAVTCIIKSNSDNVIKNFYIKKKQQARPLSHKAALIACTNKLLRIIYSISKKGEFFNQ